jgi:hypothetical protein
MVAVASLEEEASKWTRVPANGRMTFGANDWCKMQQQKQSGYLAR